MAPESIIEKIQKLLSLKEGAEKIGSLKEAANAAEKAQALLIKHNLEMADINTHKGKNKIGKSTLEDVQAKKNEGQWIYSLYQVLAIHNFCDIVFSRTFTKDRKLVRYPNLIGTKENVEVVMFLADQLELKIRELEIRAWRTTRNEKRNSFRRAYFMGATMGINSQLQESKAKAMRENSKVNSLVIVNDAELSEAVSQLFPNLRKGKSNRTLKSGTGSYLGYLDGKSMAINTGVGNSGTKSSLRG